MAGLNVCIPFDSQTLTVNAWKSVCSMKAPTNQMVRVKRLKLGADGIDGAAAACRMRIVRVDTANPGTGSAATPRKTNNALSTTPQTTGKHTFTVEPTEISPAEQLFFDAFHPQGGISQDWEFSEFFLKEGTEAALQVHVPSGGAAVKLTGHFEIEE